MEPDLVPDLSLQGSCNKAKSKQKPRRKPAVVDLEELSKSLDLRDLVKCVDQSFVKRSECSNSSNSLKKAYDIIRPETKDFQDKDQDEEAVIQEPDKQLEPLGPEESEQQEQQEQQQQSAEPRTLSFLELKTNERLIEKELRRQRKHENHNNYGKHSNHFKSFAREIHEEEKVEEAISYHEEKKEEDHSKNHIDFGNYEDSFTESIPAIKEDVVMFIDDFDGSVIKHRKLGDYSSHSDRRQSNTQDRRPLNINSSKKKSSNSQQELNAEMLNFGRAILSKVEALSKQVHQSLVTNEVSTYILAGAESKKPIYTSAASDETRMNAYNAILGKHKAAMATGAFFDINSEICENLSAMSKRIKVTTGMILLFLISMDYIVIPEVNCGKAFNGKEGKDMLLLEINSRIEAPGNKILVQITRAGRRRLCASGGYRPGSMNGVGLDTLMIDTSIESFLYEFCISHAMNK